MDKKTAQRCLNIAKGCHDYNGGHNSDKHNQIYHHGIQTVINCLEKFVEGNDSFQLKVVENIGERGYAEDCGRKRKIS